MKPRVAYTIEQCWHTVPGGTAVAGIEMARAVTESDLADLVGVAARHRRPPPEPFVPPIPVRHLALPRIPLYEAWSRLRLPKVERATGPVDVIHATTIAVPPRTRPMALSIHDLAFVRYPEHFTAHGLRFFRRNLRLALADADLVLCSSKAVWADAETAGFSPDRLRMVPLGVRSEVATPAAVDRVRATYWLERPYILWTGTVEPRKNLRGLLEAFRALDAKADLVLVGPKGWNEDLTALIEPLGDRVKPLGFVPAGDLGPLYAGATAFVFPSFAEGFGFPVLEAMTQGTPVVTSRGTSTEEIGGDAVVLVDPTDPGSIAKGLAQVLDEGSFAAELGARGKERATHYSWDRTAELLSEVYEELAKKG